MDTFKVTVLNYDYKAFEPYISEEIMRIHHSIHHQDYVEYLNKQLKILSQYDKCKLDQILTDNDAPKIFLDNLAGHYNHSFFWAIMNPVSDKKEIENELGSAIIKQYCSLDYLIDIFSARAINMFGSGWIWLVANDKELSIVTTKNEENPVMLRLGIPILCLDVWEHAYYLQYKDDKRKYIDAWWNVVNWKNVNILYKKYAMKGVNVNVKRNGSINMTIK